MTQTTARIKQTGKHFEIIVDLDRALKYKKGEINAVDFLEIDSVFTDAKKGLKAPEKELTAAFGTTDIFAIAGKIVKSGEIQTTQEHRDEARENKIKQVVDLLSRSIYDPQSGRPYTPDRIKRALEEAHVNIKNGPVENQLKDIVSEISRVIPIKVDEKKFEVTIPAMYTGQAYGVISPYKEKEEWMNNGDLRVVVAVSGAIVLSFFDKLNAVTHGAATTEEIKDK